MTVKSAVNASDNQGLPRVVVRFDRTVQSQRVLECLDELGVTYRIASESNHETPGITIDDRTFWKYDLARAYDKLEKLGLARKTVSSR